MVEVNAHILPDDRNLDGARLIFGGSAGQKNGMTNRKATTDSTTSRRPSKEWLAKKVPSQAGCWGMTECNLRRDSRILLPLDLMSSYDGFGGTPIFASAPHSLAAVETGPWLLSKRDASL